MQEKVENLFLAESNETAKHFGSPIFFHFYAIHDVTPIVVAIAVSMLISN